jgi:hypothetical protein
VLAWDSAGQDVIISLVWCFTPIIPALQEVEVGGSPSVASLGKSMTPYVKNHKRVGGLPQAVERLPACLVSARPSFQPPEDWWHCIGGFLHCFVVL